MTDEEQALVKVGAEAALKPFTNLIEALFGGSVEEIGGMWQEALRVRRFARRLRLYKRVQEIIAEAGFEPRQVNDKIAFQVLNFASIEEDETLQEKWAALLANEADPRNDNRLHPSFSVLLNQLTSREIRFLDALFRAAFSDASLAPYAPPLYPQKLTFSRHDLQKIFVSAGLTRYGKLTSISVKEYDDNKAVLVRDYDDFDLVLDAVVRERILIERENTQLDEPEYARASITKLPPSYSLSKFGESFLRACQKPSRDKP